MIKYDVADDGSAVKIETEDNKPDKLTALSAEEYKAEIGMIEDEIASGDEIDIKPKKTTKVSA